MKKCVFAGSFDPMTLGHEEIIKKASKIFDEVYVLLSINPNKKATFTKEQRLSFIKDTVKKYPNVKVDESDGLLVDYMKKENISFNVRGIRNGIDLEYENQMTYINTDLMPELITVYLPCSLENKKISSTVVKELLSFKKDVSSYVPMEVFQKLTK